MRLLVSLILCCSVFAAQNAWSDEVVLQFGTRALRAEIASSPQQRAQGLMNRTSLCTDCGMLFVFPIAAAQGFWMKDTHLPLSIAFLAPDGRVINIADMQPDTLDAHWAEGNALFALEMNRGWFAQNGIKAGDRLLGVEKLGPGR
jgi:uncharacterized membrane protein (UPF0127 family)